MTVPIHGINALAYIHASYGSPPGGPGKVTIMELRIPKSKGKPIDIAELDDQDGEFLVRVSRDSVKHYLLTGSYMNPPKSTPEKLYRPGAAFVTIEKIGGPRREKELRGCIGSVTPVNPLIETVIKVAVDAAVGDPRFPPMTLDELDSVVFEVTVLGKLKPLPGDPSQRIKEVRLGRDGLLVIYGPYQGLLLPQVPLDHNWSIIDFFMYTCIKAGLPGDCWLHPDVRFYKFPGVSWIEKEPGGEVVRRL